MPRPLVWIFLASVLGIVIAEYLPAAGPVLLPVSVLSVLAGGALACAGKRPVLRAFLILLAALSLFGFNHFRRRWLRPANHVSRIRFERRSWVEWTGTVATEPARTTFERWWTRAPEHTAFDLRAREARCNDTRLAVKGIIRVKVNGLLPELDVRDQVSIRGRFYPLRQATNPGGEGYHLYLERGGAGGTLIVERPERVKVLRKGAWWRPERVVAGLRRTAARSVELMAPAGETRALAKCLIVGDTTSLNTESRDRLARAGVYHLVVVSGLHLAIVALLVWAPLIFLGVRDRTQAAILILSIVVYAAITGLRPPVERAALMAIMTCGAMLVERRPDPLSAVSGAGVIMLAARPEELFNIGFKLSFLAVFAILVLTPEFVKFFRQAQTDDPLKALLRRRPSLLRRVASLAKQPLLAAVAAWLGVAPALAYHFHLVTLGGIIGNVILVPVLALVLTFGLGGALAVSAVPAVAPFFGAALRASLAVFSSIAALLERARLLYLYVPDIHLTGLAGGYAAVVGLWLGLRRTLRPRAAAALAACGLALIAVGLRAPKCLTPEITLLDVSHGLATIIRLPGGRTFVFDAGTYNFYDVGRNTVAPALWSKGIWRVDEIILSHSHQDHISGALDVVDRFRPGRVRVNPEFDRLMGGRTLLARIGSANPPVVCVAGETLCETRGCRLKVLYPPEGLRASNINNGSLLLDMTSPEGRILLFADQEEAALDWILRRGGLECDAVVLPHHGRVRPDRLRALMEATGARTAFISAKQASEIPSTLKILEDLGVSCYSTFRHGAITARLTEGGLQVETYRGAPGGPAAASARVRGNQTSSRRSR